MSEFLKTTAAAMVATLLTTIIGLCVYVYSGDLSETKEDTVANEEAIEQVDKNVNILNVSLLEKIYSESRLTNQSINEIAKSQAVMSEKLNNTMELVNEAMVKLEDHELRIGTLEKDVGVLKKNSKLTIFGWESN